MATVVTVHGTFAHSAGTADALGLNENADLQWWQAGSSFEAHTRALIRGADGKLEFVPFVWSSVNSELARRNAGSSLLTMLRGLEARQENYCLIGHSHGGSVIASALVESVARGAPLQRHEEVDFRRHALRRAQEGALPLFAAFADAAGDVRRVADALDDVSVLRRGRDPGWRRTCQQRILLAHGCCSRAP